MFFNWFVSELTSHNSTSALFHMADVIMKVSYIWYNRGYRLKKLETIHLKTSWLFPPVAKLQRHLVCLSGRFIDFVWVQHLSLSCVNSLFSLVLCGLLSSYLQRDGLTMSKLRLCDLIEWLSQLDSTEKHSHKIQLLTFLHPPLFASFSSPLASSPLTSSGYG